MYDKKHQRGNLLRHVWWCHSALFKFNDHSHRSAEDVHYWVSFLVRTPNNNKSVHTECGTLTICLNSLNFAISLALMEVSSNVCDLQSLHDAWTHVVFSESVFEFVYNYYAFQRCISFYRLSYSLQISSITCMASNSALEARRKSSYNGIRMEVVKCRRFELMK